jgi:hypothetical protein
MGHQLRPRPERADGPVGIQVTAEQHCLEEQHGRDPDRRRPAEPRQDHLRDHGLDLEEQERAQEDGGSVKKHKVAKL